MAENARLNVPAAPESPRSARRFITDQLQDWGYQRVAQDAALLTSELVTNAVKHATEPFVVEVMDLHNGVVVTVEDAEPELPPLPRSPGPEAVGGRGLAIVQSIATSWGAWTVPAGGKFVWFRLAAALLD